MAKQSPLRIGLVGAGRIGKVHAETIAQRISGAELVAVADPDLVAAREIGELYGIELVTADPQDVFAHPDVEAVAICSSTDTHAQFIIDAARAGKHIFCEKPVDHSLARIDAALAAVAAAGVKLQIGFNRRFDPNFRKVRAAIADGTIGDLHILRITSRDPAPPPIAYVKVSGGIFLDMAIHDFDMARFLTGSEVEEVYTAAAVRVDPAIGELGDVDTAVIMLKFANGVIGTIDNSRRAVYGYDQRVEAFGSEGMIRVLNNKPNTSILSDAAGVHAEKPLFFFLERYMDAYEEEMRQFVTAVREDKPVPVGGLDGRHPVIIALAAKRSLDENRPVRLSEIE